MIRHLILYHMDNDGYCSAAIVKKYLEVFKVNLDEVKFYPIDYHKVDKFFQWFENRELVDNLYHLVILDFSFGNNWGRLLETIPLEKITWIDHHANAIENGYGTDILKAKGLRSSDNAGCSLTWKYFFPGTFVPYVVQLVEDYDIWKFVFEDDSFAFLYGSQAEGDRISNPESPFWQILLSEVDNKCYGHLLRAILKDGHNIKRYVIENHKSQCKEKAYISKFWCGDLGIDKSLKCVVCNAGRGSAIFDSVTDDYDMMVVYWFDGEQFNYSFYSKKGGMDVSVIARQYGGNGHKNAAGCRSEKMLFPKNAEVRWSDET